MLIFIRMHIEGTSASAAPSAAVINPSSTSMRVFARCLLHSQDGASIAAWHNVTLPGPMATKCRDNDSWGWCSPSVTPKWEWKCENSFAFRDNCPKTCGLCGGELPSPPASADTPGPP